MQEMHFNFVKSRKLMLTIMNTVVFLCTGAVIPRHSLKMKGSMIGYRRMFVVITPSLLLRSGGVKCGERGRKRGDHRALYFLLGVSKTGSRPVS